MNKNEPYLFQWRPYLYNRYIWGSWSWVFLSGTETTRYNGGGICHFAKFNKVLTSDEVRIIYNEPV